MKQHLKKDTTKDKSKKTKQKRNDTIQYNLPHFNKTNDIDIYNFPYQLNKNNNQLNDSYISSSTVYSIKGDLPNKNFEKLITLPILATDYIRSLTNGDFIERSKDRWKKIDIRPIEPNKMIKKLVETSALVIQCHWRRYMAQMELQNKKNYYLNKRRKLSKNILKYKKSIIYLLSNFKSLVSVQKNLLHLKEQSIVCLFKGTMKLYYNTAALFIYFSIKTLFFKFQMKYIKCNAFIKKLIDLPMIRTINNIWYFHVRISQFASVVIQCKFRVFSAKKKYDFYKKLHHENQSAIQIQCYVRKYFSFCYFQYLKQRYAIIIIQCFIRQKYARKVYNKLILKKFVKNKYNEILKMAFRSTIFCIQTRAAMKIQKRQRGIICRNSIRKMQLSSGERIRLLGTTRGYELYQNNNFHDAAIFLQFPFFMGIYGDDNHGEFWQKLGIAHFKTWENNGDEYNLKMAKIALNRAFKINKIIFQPNLNVKDTKETNMFVDLTYHWILTLFHLNELKKCEETALFLLKDVPCIETYKEIYIRVQFIMSMIFFQNDNIIDCIKYLEALNFSCSYLILEISEIEFLFLLACVYNKTDKKEKIIEIYQTVYRHVELQPGNGFYHGQMSDAKADKVFQKYPVGSFLVHSKSSKEMKDIETKEEIFYLKVKQPILDKEGNIQGSSKIREMKIKKNLVTGEYSSSKINFSGIRFYSLNEFLISLPASSGINIKLGIVKKSKLTNDQNKKISKTFGKEKERISAMICPTVTYSLAEWLEKKQTWLNISIRFEEKELYIFSRYISEFILDQKLTLKLGLRNAEGKPNHAQSSDNERTKHEDKNIKDIFESMAYFITAKCFRNLSCKMDSLIFIQRAIQKYNSFEFEAIRKSWILPNSSFEDRLEKIYKLERMVTRGYHMHRYSASLKGNIHQSALLLQIVANDNYPGNLQFWHELSSLHLMCYEKRKENIHKVLCITAIDRGFSIFKSSGIISEKYFYDAGEFLYRLAKIDKASETMRLYIVKYPRSPKIPIILLRLSFLYKYKKQNKESLYYLNQFILLTKRQEGYIKLKKPDIIFLKARILELLETENNDKYYDNSHHEFSCLKYYDAAHRIKIKVVKKYLHGEKLFVNTKNFRENYFKSVQVTVGDTRNLLFKNILNSKPYIKIQVLNDRNLENVKKTLKEPTWSTLNPSWNNETIELNISSLTDIIILYVNDANQINNSYIGKVEIPFMDIVQFGQTEGGYYKIIQTARLNENIGYYSRNNKYPLNYSDYLRIRSNMEFKKKQCLEKNNKYITKTVSPEIYLSFKLLTRKITYSKSIMDSLDISFQCSEWLKQVYPWEEIGIKLYKMKEYMGAIDFLVEAIVRRDLKNKKNSTNQMNLIYMLASCYYACSQIENSIKWLKKGIYLNLNLVNKDDREIKLLTSKFEWMLHELRYPARSFEEKLEKASISNASSTWIMKIDKDQSRTKKYYFNEETQEIVEDEPINYETGKEIAKNSISYLKKRSKKFILSKEMNTRIHNIHQKMIESFHLDEKMQWYEIFDDKVKRYIYISRTFNSVSFEKPETYVMMVDDTVIIYYVLLLQDLYRIFAKKRRRSREIKKIHKKMYNAINIVAYILRMYYIRKEKKEVIQQKSKLNTIKIKIKCAKKLRAADLITSDPYVILEISTKKDKFKNQTSIRKKSLNPVWNETFYLKYLWNNTEKEILASKDSDGKVKFTQDDTSKEGFLNQGIKKTNLMSLVKKKTQVVEPILLLIVMDADDDKEHDFLGMAGIPIYEIDHGKEMDVWLNLRDEDGYYSPRSRGLVNITVQWIQAT